jgi:hypothetical protein
MRLRSVLPPVGPEGESVLCGSDRRATVGKMNHINSQLRCDHIDALLEDLSCLDFRYVNF